MEIKLAGNDPYQQVSRAWKRWRKDKSHITAKLYKNYIRKADWFLTTHAASEAALRRLIFIGLRRHGVTYGAAETWMDGHAITFGKSHGNGSFSVYFDRLYAEPWAEMLREKQGLEQLWEIWNDFAKPVRNHLAHGARKYPDEWLDAGLAVNRLLMMGLDEVTTPILGGSPFSHLTKLKPRLGRGDPSLKPEAVLNIRANRDRDLLSLDEAQERLDRLIRGE
jgi:hypothetical protein